MKTCTKCEKVKSIKEFSWLNKAKGRKRAGCKACANEYNKQYREINYEQELARCRRYKKDNLKKVRKQNRQRSKEYKKNNPDIVNAINAKRRAQKLQATPVCVNKGLIDFYYKIAATMAEYEVDHIKPLSKGGLHHQNNLQILLTQLNLEKYNKWPLTEEEQNKYIGFRL